MKMTLSCLLLLLCVSSASLVQARNVYSWQEADGTITYADRPLNQQAQIYQPQSPMLPTPTPQGDPAAERKKRKCLLARERIKQYSVEADIRRVDEQTGRVMRLSDDEKAVLLAEAQQDSEVWCTDAAPAPQP